MASVRLVGGTQPATELSDSTCEGAALTSVRLVAVGPASHCGGVYGRGLRFSGLGSRVRGGRSQPLGWWGRQVRALLWPLIAWSAWTQPTIVVAGTTYEVASLAFASVLASVLSFAVG